MPKFSRAAVDNESQCDEKGGCDLSNDSDDLIVFKRGCETQQIQSDLQLPLKMLKKDIKIEKD